MKLTIEIPDPKFSPGDVLRSGPMVFAVNGIMARGTWGWERWRSGRGGDFIEDESVRYELVTQDGCRNAKGCLVRPGIILSRSMADLEETATKLDFAGEIVGPDNDDNINEREAAWQERMEAIAVAEANEAFMRSASESTTTVRVYRGFLTLGSNGEEDDLLLAIGIEQHRWEPTFLSEQIQDDIFEHGSYLTVRYYVANSEMDADAIRNEKVMATLGLGDAKYEVRYSDYTGYLWTDEELNVGGHDLLAELKSHVGKFCQLEIGYSREAPKS